MRGIRQYISSVGGVLAVRQRALRLIKIGYIELTL